MTVLSRKPKESSKPNEASNMVTLCRQIRKVSIREQEASSRIQCEKNIEKCILSLVHACQCRDATCSRMTCPHMKRVVQHCKTCSKRASCSACKQLIALCCYHAKKCQEDVEKCTVLFCQKIKKMLAEQKAIAKEETESASQSQPDDSAATSSDDVKHI